MFTVIAVIFEALDSVLKHLIIYFKRINDWRGFREILCFISSEGMNRRNVYKLLCGMEETSKSELAHTPNQPSHGDEDCAVFWLRGSWFWR